MAVADGAFLIALAFTSVPHLVVFVVAVAMLGWVATFRPLAAILTGALAVASVIIRTITSDDVTLGSAVASFTMLGVIFIIRTVRLNMGARQVIEREHLIAERIDAIVWEDTGDGAGGLTVSAAAERLLGYAAASWQEPEFWSRIVHPKDRATFASMMAGDSEQAATVLELLDREVGRLVAEGITEGERDIGVGCLSGSLVLGLEDTASRLGRIGGLMSALGRVVSVEEDVAGLRAVTVADVAAVVDQVLGAPRSVAVVGPLEGDIEAALAGLGATAGG